MSYSVRVQFFLNEGSMQSEKIFHYTSVESLAMILSTGKLRFTRLDSVDDMSEGQTHAGIPFGKYFFVSCWTQQEEDNLAQWKMYGGDMEGIRIEFPAYPFRRVRMEAHGEVKVTGNLYSPIATTEMYGRNYMIIPPFVGNKSFAGPVVYVENVESRYASAIVKEKSDSGQEQIKIDGFYDLPRLKSKIWEFQAEFRFLLHVMPIVPPFPIGEPLSPTIEQAAGSAGAMMNGVDPGVTYIDVPFDPSVLDRMVIRVGPLCSDGAKVCVEALRDKLAPNAKIEVSPLAGTVRRK
jgi:hypothetical protein